VCSFDCDVGVIDPCFACVGGAKIEKMIEFAEMLGVCVCWECAVCVDLSCDTDVSPYMSDTSLDAQYRLCGVVVHSGHSMRSGHYYAFVPSAAGVW
jgi:hypothetical protein